MFQKLTFIYHLTGSRRRVHSSTDLVQTNLEPFSTEITHRARAQEDHRLAHSRTTDGACANINFFLYLPYRGQFLIGTKLLQTSITMPSENSHQDGKAWTNKSHRTSGTVHLIPFKRSMYGNISGVLINVQIGDQSTYCVSRWYFAPHNDLDGACTNFFEALIGQANRFDKLASS